MSDQTELKPTLEQLENLAVALGFPLLPEALRPPYYEESLRNLHTLVTKVIQGDEDAARHLQALRSSFGRG